MAPEVISDGVHVTTIYMPLVRTPMIAPTRLYDRFPTLTSEQAAGMITEAIRKRPKRMGTTMGNIGQLTYAIAPGAQDLVANQAYQLFPEGDGARLPEGDGARLPEGDGAKLPEGDGAKPETEEPTVEQRAFVRATPGVHW
jgi:hypothetical protein